MLPAKLLTPEAALLLKAPIDYAFPSCSRQRTRCTYMQQTRSTHTLEHFVASYAACTRGAGPQVYCLVQKMESDEAVLQACAAIVVADALLVKPKRKRKKLVNDYLLERTTKGSYGGLLLNCLWEKEIFKEYLRTIQSSSVSSEILCIQYFCIHQGYCILQRYKVSQPAVVIQSISASCGHTEYLCMTR